VGGLPDAPADPPPDPVTMLVQLFTAAMAPSQPDRSSLPFVHVTGADATHAKYAWNSALQLGKLSAACAHEGAHSAPPLPGQIVSKRMQSYAQSCSIVLPLPGAMSVDPPVGS